MKCVTAYNDVIFLDYSFFLYFCTLGKMSILPQLFYMLFFLDYSFFLYFFTLCKMSIYPNYLQIENDFTKCLLFLYVIISVNFKLSQRKKRTLIGQQSLLFGGFLHLFLLVGSFCFGFLTGGGARFRCFAAAPSSELLSPTDEDELERSEELACVFANACFSDRTFELA